MRMNTMDANNLQHEAQRKETEAKLKGLAIELKESMVQRIEEQPGHKELAAKYEEAIATLTVMQIRPGTYVLLKGVQKRSDLNGHEAKVLIFDTASVWCECDFLDGASVRSTVGCKLQNLEINQIRLIMMRWRANSGSMGWRIHIGKISQLCNLTHHTKTFIMI